MADVANILVVVTGSDVNMPTQEPTMKWLLKFAGVIEDMPSDFAAQHDHYLHGTPKR